MNKTIFATLLLALATGPGLAADGSPTAIFPGTSSSGPLSAPACPTFHWTAVPAAAGYEIAVYSTEGAPGEPPTLRRRLPAGSIVWTPALESCLPTGASYAWTVRALGAPGDGWAEPLLFRVPSGPSAAEVERAIEVLTAWRETATAGVGRSSPRRPSPSSESTAVEPSPEQPARSPSTAPDGPKISVDGAIEALSFRCNNCLTVDELGRGSVGSSEVADGALVIDDMGFDPATQAELDDHGRDALAHHSPPSSLPPNGPASGGLSGAYPSPSIAADAVTGIEILGEEVAFYTVNASCASAGTFTFAETCQTLICYAEPLELLEWWRCNGTCGASGPRTCPNELRGYLLDPAVH